jgi:hypothetical protein
VRLRLSLGIDSHVARVLEVQQLQVRRQLKAIPDLVDAAAEVWRVDYILCPALHEYHPAPGHKEWVIHTGKEHRLESST